MWCVRLCPATSSSRFTQPNYWRDPNSGNAFQIQVQLPQNRDAERGSIVGDCRSCRRAPEAALDDIAGSETGHDAGLIERYNGQHVVSLTANIHDITLGEAAQKLNQALADSGTAPRGAKIVMKGEIPPLAANASPGCGSVCCWQWWRSFCCWRRTFSPCGWRWRSF